jgi:hypothetical protein
MIMTVTIAMNTAASLIVVVVVVVVGAYGVKATQFPMTIHILH